MEVLANSSNVIYSKICRIWLKNLLSSYHGIFLPAIMARVGKNEENVENNLGDEKGSLKR